MKYKYILFDLDGTLIDSAIGVTNAVMYALKKYGIEVSDRTELYKFIGPPLKDTYQNHYGFSDKELKKVLGYHREYYIDKGVFESVLYDGYEELLEQLKKHNKTLIVATSKAEVFARQILENIGVAKYFTYIAGSNIDGSRADKYEVIKYALESSNVTELEKTVMVGDRKYDIIGAKKLGIDTVGVLFGYGNRLELEEAGADIIVNEVSELEDILLA